jgi:hypothetical protein
MGALCDGFAPGQKLTVARVDIGGLASCHEVSLDKVYATLDLAFMLGSGRTTGSNEEAVVFGQFGVGAVDLRILPGGLLDAGFEVVNDQALWRTAK